MKTTDRLQEVHRQYEAMERAVKRLRELRDEVVRDLLTLRELLHSEAQERRKLVETLRGQWRLVFIVGTIAGLRRIDPECACAVAGRTDPGAGRTRLGDSPLGYPPCGHGTETRRRAPRAEAEPMPRWIEQFPGQRAGAHGRASLGER